MGLVGEVSDRAGGVVMAVDTDPAGDRPVVLENTSGKSDFVILCDHASNRIPQPFYDLGLPADALEAHIAWDPGALAVSKALSRMLDATLVYPTISRLVVDCNRRSDAPDLVPEISETTVIPGNAGLDDEARDRRIKLVHEPYHEMIDAVLEERSGQGRASMLVAIHSFTPVYKGVARPWEIGILSDGDRRLADPMLADLRRDAGLTVGDNEPYAPGDGVYFTLTRHGEARGLACAMVEIRNDEIADPKAEEAWARRLATTLQAAREAVVSKSV